MTSFYKVTLGMPALLPPPLPPLPLSPCQSGKITIPPPSQSIQCEDDEDEDLYDRFPLNEQQMIMLYT